MAITEASGQSNSRSQRGGGQRQTAGGRAITLTVGGSWSGLTGQTDNSAEMNFGSPDELTKYRISLSAAICLQAMPAQEGELGAGFPI